MTSASKDMLLLFILPGPDRERGTTMTKGGRISCCVCRLTPGFSERGKVSVSYGVSCSIPPGNDQGSNDSKSVRGSPGVLFIRGE